MTAVNPSLMRRVVAALALVMLTVIGCRDGALTGPNPIPKGSGRLSVVAQFELNTATNLVIEVTAPDITVPLVFNLPVVDGSATGSVTIPAGGNRLIVVRAFDGRTETHRGSRTVTIVEGTNAPLTLPLIPLAGTLPVTVTFGVAVVTVTPLTWELKVDERVDFNATVMDATGTMQPNIVVRWASTDTRLLTIDSTGLATARDTGTVTVVAVAGGAAGRATVTITPADSLIPPSFQRTWVGGNGTGSNQTSWINPNNWSPAAVPTANDSVVIGTAAFQPVLPAVDTLRVRDLTLRSGANLNLSGRNLTISGGALTGLGGVTNTSFGGTLRLAGNARFSGTFTAPLLVQGGGTVTLADSARVPSITVSGASTVLALAGRRLVTTAAGTAVNVVTEAILRMNNPADTLDVSGNLFLQSSAASHAGNLTAGTMIIRGNISDGSRYEASGTHRTLFLGAVASIGTQGVNGFDTNARPANGLQDVVIAGSSAWSHCSPNLRVRGTFTVSSPVTVTNCTSYTMRVDGAISTVPGSTFDPYGVVLGDVSGTSGIAGALTSEFLTFATANPQLRTGLAYRGLSFQQSASITDSLRTTGAVTVSGSGVVLDIATPAGRAVTFGSLTVQNGAALSMTDPGDSLVVVGVLTANNSAELFPTLTAGTLRLGATLNGSNFGTSGTHHTILDGASPTTWQDINSMDANARANNVFRNLTIAHGGIGVRSCFSNVRVNGAFRVVGTSTYSTCGGNFTRVDSLLATAAGTTVNAYGFTLANANGTQDVLGSWTVGFTDFTLPNQPVRANLGYDELRFFASNTLPAGITTTASLFISGTTTLLTLSDGRVTTAALTTQSGGRFAMNAGDTLRVRGTVNLNGGQSTPSGGVLEIESTFNASGYAPTGTHELRLRGPGTHALGGFNDRPLPTLRIVSGTALMNFMNLIVQDSILLSAGTSLTTNGGNFLTVRGRIETAEGSSMTPYGVALEGPATLAAVNGSFAPGILRVLGPGTGPGTVLRNGANIAYTDVEFYTSYALSDSLSVTGYVYASGAGVVLDWNGRKIRAPLGLNFDANASGRMVNVSDSLIVGDGANGTQSLRWDSGTSGTVSAGTILIRGGTTSMSWFVGTGTNHVIYSDSGLASTTRSSALNGGATFRRLSVHGQPQFTVTANFNTITVTDSLRVRSGTFFVNNANINVDGTGQAVLAVDSAAVLTSSGGSVNLASPVGTSLVQPGATFTPTLVRFQAGNPVVNPSLGYNNVEFYGPVTFTGNTNIGGYLYAQNAGAGVTLGGNRVNVANYVDMGTNAFLVMTNAADTLDVGQDLAVNGGVNSTLTNGVILFRGNTLTGTNLNAVAPHRTVFLGTTGTPQNVNGNTAFGRVEVAGGRGFNANFSTYTVADTFLVSGAVPIVGGGTMNITGPLVALSPIAISTNLIRLRHESGTANLQPGTTFGGGTIALSQASGTASAVRPNLTYSSLAIESPVTLSGPIALTGNLSVANGLNPSLTLNGYSVTVAGQVDVLNAGRLFMTNEADLLRTTGTNYTYIQGSAGTGELSAGTLEVSGDYYPYSTGHEASGSHRVLMTRSDTRTQAVQQSGNVAIQNLEIGGTGARTVTINTALDVLGALSVTSPAPVTLTQSSTHALRVVGGFSAPSSATINIPGTLRTEAATGITSLLGTVSIGSLTIGGLGLNQIVPTDPRYTIGNLNVLAGASASIASGARRIGSGTSGTLTVNGTLTIPDGSTLQACRSDNGGLAGGSPGLIRNLGSGGAPLLLRLPGPLTSTTFGASGGTTSGVAISFGVTTGC